MGPKILFIFALFAPILMLAAGAFPRAITQLPKLILGVFPLSFSTSAVAVLIVVALLASVHPAETRFPLNAATAPVGPDDYTAPAGPDDYVEQLCRRYSICALNAPLKRR